MSVDSSVGSSARSTAAVNWLTEAPPAGTSNRTVIECETDGTAVTEPILSRRRRPLAVPQLGWELRKQVTRASGGGTPSAADHEHALALGGQRLAKRRRKAGWHASPSYHQPTTPDIHVAQDMLLSRMNLGLLVAPQCR